MQSLLAAPAQVVIAALSIAIMLAAYQLGRRHQAYEQARADARDQRVKLRKARRARTAAGRAAAAGWALLLVGAACAGLLLAALGSGR